MTRTVSRGGACARDKDWKITDWNGDDAETFCSIGLASRVTMRKSKANDWYFATVYQEVIDRIQKQIDRSISVWHDESEYDEIMRVLRMAADA